MASSPRPTDEDVAKQIVDDLFGVDRSAKWEDPAFLATALYDRITDALDAERAAVAGLVAAAKFMLLATEPGAGEGAPHLSARKELRAALAAVAGPGE